MSRQREAARSNLLMTPLVALAGMAATVAVVRALSPEAFAVYAVVLAFKATVQFAGDFGTGAAATRLFGELHAQDAGRQARRLYARLLAIRGLIGLAFVLVVVVFPDALGDALNLREDERDILPLLAAIGVIEVASSLGYAVLAGCLRHRWINRAVLASTLAQPAAVIAAAAAGLGLEWIVAGLLLGSVLRGGGWHLGAVLALRHMTAGEATRAGVARAYVRTATGSVLGKVAAWLHSRQLVTLIAIHNAPRADVAVFALAYDFVAQVVTALASPFSSLLLPLQAQAVGDEARARRTYATAVRLLALLILPASALLLALFPPLVDVLFGDAYADAVLFALLFVPSTAAELVLSGPATALMLADDRVLGAYGRIKAVTIALAAAYVLLSDADLLVLAGAMAVIRTASTLALVLAVRRRLGIVTGGPWVAGLLATTLAAGGAALLPALLVEPALLGLALGGLAGVVVLVGVARRVRLVPDEDADLARQLLPAAAPLLDIVAPRAGSSRAA